MGTWPTHFLSFGVVLAACLVIMVALSHLPTLALGQNWSDCSLEVES